MKLHKVIEVDWKSSVDAAREERRVPWWEK